MSVKFALFRTFVLCLVVGLYYYIFRQVMFFASTPMWLKALTLVCIASAMLAVLSMPFYYWTVHNKLSSVQEKGIHYAHYSMAYLNFLLVILLGRDIYAWIATGAFKHNISYMHNVPSFFLTFFLPTLITILGYLHVKRGPQIVRQSIVDARLPREFHDVRIAHISDLHVSIFLLKGFVDQLLEKVQQMKPDIIVMTGDIIDGSMEDHPHEIQRLSELTAPLGVFYVPGNHEYYWGMKQFFNKFRDFGFHSLINDSVRIQKEQAEILMCGIPDPTSHKFPSEVRIDFDPIKESFRDQEQYRILLSHQPKTAILSALQNFHLQLSGHTHGGQFFPWNWAIRFFEKYNRGHYHLRVSDHQMNLYVNQGTAYWGPALKLGTVCEVTEIRLLKG